MASYTRDIICLLLCVVTLFGVMGSLFISYSISSSNRDNYNALNDVLAVEESKPSNLVMGVNVYGWTRGDFGGGTTVRAVLNDLHTVHVNVTAIEISGADLHSTTNTAVEEKDYDLYPRKDFAFDLFVINAANTISTLSDVRNDIHKEHYRIGLWHWETSHLPPTQGYYGRYYNEIWVPSRYVRDAILKTDTFPSRNVKVVVLPYGYETLSPSASTSSLSSSVGNNSSLKSVYRKELPNILRRIAWRSREKMLVSPHAANTLEYWASSIGDNSNPPVTLFLMIFDFNSDFNRKNVVATVRSFLKAFPPNGPRGMLLNSTVGLIIKSINAHFQIDDYNRLDWILQGHSQEGISYDERIVFFNGLSSDSDLYQLKYAIDCYISLHRSEGLGLNIMEAALIGIPVIASAFSGSEQFMLPLYNKFAPEFRIPTKLVKVDRKFGPYSTDMEWGQPSEEAAINAMRLMYTYPDYYSTLAAGPIREAAVALLSPAATGTRMKDRLQLVYDCLLLIQKQHHRGKSVCLKKVLGIRTMSDEFNLNVPPAAHMT